MYERFVGPFPVNYKLDQRWTEDVLDGALDATHSQKNPALLDGTSIASQQLDVIYDCNLVGSIGEVCRSSIQTATWPASDDAFSKAKNAAMYGDSVQSNSGVGRP